MSCLHTFLAGVFAVLTCLGPGDAAKRYIYLWFVHHEILACMRYAATLALPCVQVRDSVAIHVPCSSKKMGIANAFETVAGKCAHEVVPTGVPCCGAPICPNLHGSSSSYSCSPCLSWCSSSIRA